MVGLFRLLLRVAFDRPGGRFGRMGFRGLGLRLRDDVIDETRDIRGYFRRAGKPGFLQRAQRTARPAGPTEAGSIK